MKTAEGVLNKVADIDEQELEEVEIYHVSVSYRTAIEAMHEYTTDKDVKIKELKETIEQAKGFISRYQQLITHKINDEVRDFYNKQSNKTPTQTETVENIVKTILYFPVTNNQADVSIQKGVELINTYVKNQPNPAIELIKDRIAELKPEHMEEDILKLFNNKTTFLLPIYVSNRLNIDIQLALDLLYSMVDSGKLKRRKCQGLAFELK